MGRHTKAASTVATLLCSVGMLALTGASRAADIVTLVAVGDTRAVDESGRTRNLAKGDELRAGERLETGANGRAQLRFSDGALVSIQPDTTFKVDQYQFSGKEDGKEQVFMSLLKGAFRTVTGAIGRANRNAYQLTTPTATVGIRGTEYLAQLVGQALTIRVGEGSIGIANNFGTIVVNTGQTGFVRTPTSAPQVVAVQPTLSPAPAVVTVSEAKKSEERSSSGAPTTVQDNSTGSISTLYTSTVTTGTGTTTGAAGGTASGAVSAALGTGPYVIAYAGGANIGLDSRNPVTATFAGNGAVTGYVSGASELPTVGTNSVADVSGDQFITIGRWNGGTTAGQYFVSPPFTFNGNQGFHYAVGVPSPALPTSGTATYAMLGATSPTVTDGSKTPGSALGELAVNWGGTSTKIGLHLKVTIPGDAIYEVLTSGGTANPAASEIGLGGNGMWFGNSLLTVGTGQSCAGTCNSTVRGFFAGASQERAGLSYRVGSGTSSKVIDGAMSFSPATITPISSLTLPTTGGVGPLSSAPDRIYTVTGGSIGGFGPGFFTSAAFNGTNGLTSFTGFTGTSSLGTAAVAEGGGDAFVAWGRWTNGTPVNVAGFGGAIPANAGIHYLVGTPATTLPATGTFNYNLAGASAPTISDGSAAPGTFSGALRVAFDGAATKIALNANINFNGDTYSMTTNGGLGVPSSSQITVSNSGSAAQRTQWSGTGSVLVSLPVSGPTSCVGCTANIQGSFFGANVERAGMTYSIGGLSNGTKSLSGSAAFAKQ